jgi:hypothetical protein
MTKKQQIANLTNLTQTYLGFAIEGLYGVSSMKKAELDTRIAQMKRAVAWKAYSRKLESSLKNRYGKQTILVLAISSKPDAEYEKYNRALRMASNYYHGYTTERAYKSL